MPRGKSLTANGITEHVILNQCGLMYYLGNAIHMDIIPSINIAQPEITMKNYRDIMSIPSLLGMDYLRRYSLQFTSDMAILEK
jgi:hypothetical protein